MFQAVSALIGRRRRAPASSTVTGRRLAQRLAECSALHAIHAAIASYDERLIESEDVVALARRELDAAAGVL